MAINPMDDRYVHVMDGRVRVKVPSIRRRDDLAEILENDLACLAGVTSVQANPMTGNVLVRFDSTKVDAAEVLSALGHLSGHPVALPAEQPPASDLSPLVLAISREIAWKLVKSTLPGWAVTLVEVLQ